MEGPPLLSDVFRLDQLTVVRCDTTSTPLVHYNFHFTDPVRQPERLMHSLTKHLCIAESAFSLGFCVAHLKDVAVHSIDEW